MEKALALLRAEEALRVQERLARAFAAVFAVDDVSYPLAEWLRLERTRQRGPTCIGRPALLQRARRRDLLSS